MDPKALLDELMGKDRDLPLDQQKKKRLQFDDPQVLSTLLPFSVYSSGVDCSLMAWLCTWGLESGTNLKPNRSDDDISSFLSES